MSDSRDLTCHFRDPIISVCLPVLFPPHAFSVSKVCLLMIWSCIPSCFLKSILCLTPYHHNYRTQQQHYPFLLGIHSFCDFLIDFSMDLGACGQRSHSGVSPLFEPSLSPCSRAALTPSLYPPQDCVTHTQAQAHDILLS